MYMDRTYTQTELDNYKLQVELLQEKLQRSEEHRNHLEHKLGQILKKRSEHDKTVRMKARQKYQQLVEEQQKRHERNKLLTRMLERIDEQSAALSARSERLKMMKLQYEMYFAKLVQAQTMRCMQQSAAQTTTSTPITLSDLSQTTREATEAPPPPPPAASSLSSVTVTITPTANPLATYQNLESNHIPTTAFFDSLLKITGSTGSSGTIGDIDMTTALLKPHSPLALAMPTPAGLVLTSTRTPLSAARASAAVAAASTGATRTHGRLEGYGDYEYHRQYAIVGYGPTLQPTPLVRVNEKQHAIRAEEEEERTKKIFALQPTAGDVDVDAVDVLSTMSREVRESNNSNRNTHTNDNSNECKNSNTNETKNNTGNNNVTEELFSSITETRHEDMKTPTIIRNKRITATEDNKIPNGKDNNNNNNDNSSSNFNEPSKSAVPQASTAASPSFGMYANTNRKTELPTFAISTTTSSSITTSASTPSSTSSFLPTPSSFSFDKLTAHAEKAKIVQQNTVNKCESGADATEAGAAATSAEQTTETTSKPTEVHAAKAIVKPTQTADSGSYTKRIKTASPNSLSFAESNSTGNNNNHNNIDSVKMTAVSETDHALLLVAAVHDGDNDYDGGDVANNASNLRQQKIGEDKLAVTEPITTTTKTSSPQSRTRFERKEKITIENIEDVFYGELLQTNYATAVSPKESGNQAALMATGDIMDTEEFARNSQGDPQSTSEETDGGKGFSTRMANQSPPAAERSERKQATESKNEKERELPLDKEASYEEDPQNPNVALAMYSENGENHRDAALQAAEDTSQYPYYPDPEEEATPQKIGEYDPDYNYHNYEAATYQASCDTNEYPGYSYDESSSQYVADDVNQRFTEAETTYLQQHGQYDDEQQQQQPQQHLSEDTNHGFKEPYQPQTQEATNDYDESTTLGGDIAAVTEISEVEKLQENNAEVAVVTEINETQIESTPSPTQPLKTAPVPKNSTNSTLKTANPLSSSPPPSRVSNSSIKPTSILSTEKFTAANDAQHSKKKKKRVNFVDSSETDDSSSVKQEGVAGFTESDFDFSSSAAAGASSN